MSKVDAMRAIKDARFAAAAKGAPVAAPAVRRTPTQAAPPVRPEATAAASSPDVEVQDGLCGHRNIGGRSCTREADHQKTGTKSHRYG